jgi:hypothetical protein
MMVFRSERDPAREARRVYMALATLGRRCGCDDDALMLLFMMTLPASFCRPATAGRIRPLSLTPIAPTIFQGPGAIAILGGLLVASLPTLAPRPVLYITGFGRHDRNAPRPAVGPGTAGTA